MTHRYSLEDEGAYAHPSQERQALTALDPDVTDFYDGPEGLPAPHRLSGIHSTSPYPSSFLSQESFNPTNSNPNLNLNRQSISKADPFRTSFDTPYNPNSVRGSRGDSVEMSSNPNLAYGSNNYNYGAGVGYGSPYGSVPNYDNDDDYSRPSMNNDDAWGIPKSTSGDSYSSARERYVARKEAGASGLGSGSGANAGYAKPQKSRLWWWVGGLMAIIILAGVIAGVVIATRGGGGAGKKSKSTGPVFDGNDPSVFQKNDTYKQSFYGIAYSPIGSQLSEGCSNTIDSVIYDVQIMSQLTTQIRGYGADCNQTAQVLQAIHDTKTDLIYWPGIYISADTDPTQEEVYERQVANLTEAINEYGPERIGGVQVGNEYLLNKGTVPGLLAFVEKFRNTAAANNWKFPIGTGDAASMFTPELGAGIDFFMGNNHPWFAGVTIEDAPSWSWNYWQQSVVTPASTLPNQPKVYVGEIGWPSQANDTQSATYQGSVASQANLQTFINDYACQSTANGTLSFFFEMYDEEWKEIAFGGVEGYWGLFDKNKRLKDLTFPSC